MDFSLICLVFFFPDNLNYSCEATQMRINTLKREQSENNPSVARWKRRRRRERGRREHFCGLNSLKGRPQARLNYLWSPSGAGHPTRRLFLAASDLHWPPALVPLQHAWMHLGAFIHHLNCNKAFGFQLSMCFCSRIFFFSKLSLSPRRNWAA